MMDQKEKDVGAVGDNSGWSVVRGGHDRGRGRGRSPRTRKLVEEGTIVSSKV